MKMVVIDTKDTYCPAIMEALNNLRKFSSYCDTNIVIGDYKLPAHKNVLIVGSDYFKSCFGGPFKDVTSDIDLSFMTVGVTNVEEALNFLYTGQVDTNKENIGSLLKISSFLFISKLRKYCIDFIKTTINQDTVITYYFLSIDNTLVNLEKQLKETLHTRFYDWLIFDPSSLEVSPQQLSILIQNCEIFEFCSDAAVFEYIMEWCLAGATEYHDTLTCEVLEFLYKKEGMKIDQTQDEFQALECLKAKLVDSLTKSNVCSKVQKAISKLLRKLLPETKMHLRSAESKDIESSSDKFNETESALVVIVPNQHLKELGENTKIYHNTEKIKEKESIYNSYIYIPRLQKWYQLNDGLYHVTLKEITNEECAFDYFGTLDKVYCLLPFYDYYMRTIQIPDIDRIDASGFVEFSDEVADFINGHEEDDISLQERYCIISADKTVYLILGVNVEAEMSLHFRCYKLTTDDKWQFLFSTPKIYKDSNYCGGVCGCVSPMGNEIIVLYSRGVRADFLIYVAQLTEGGANVIQLRADQPVSDDWNILKDKERFYLVEVVHLDGEIKRFACKYTYTFKSQVMLPHNATGVEQDGSLKFNDGKDHEPLLIFDKLAADETSMWVFTGLEHYGSTLTEISIDGNGNLNQSFHTPPPFCCVTAFFTCKLSSECLAKAKQVKSFNPVQ